MTGEPPLDTARLRALCYSLGDTNIGLTGSEIGRLLAECDIEDVAEGTSKRDRLYAALKERQDLDRSSNYVLAFVQAALNPVRYTGRPEYYARLRESTNRVLSFAGLFVGDDGKVLRVEAATTIPEAVGKASGLMTELVRRGIHPEVLKSARTELQQEDYVHAVFEATKGLAEALRLKVHSSEDGWNLVDYALAGNRKKQPRFAINKLESETDWSEHNGLTCLLKGVFSLLRNPPAHTPRSKYVLSQTDALESLAVVSLLHRRIEELVPTNPSGPPN